MDYATLLNEIADEIKPFLNQGIVASYIPALQRVSGDHFGLALATVDGEVFGVGDFQQRFSVQSVAKVFSLALVLSRDGEALWQRVGREPSGNPFNSLVQLEYEHGIPRNPFINAGALVVVDRLQSLSGNSWQNLRDFLRAESGSSDLDYDVEVFESETQFGHRNAALAHFMASYGNLNNPVPEVLAHYFWQCSLTMNCAELARASVFLARHGLRQDGSRILSRSEAKRINAVMMTCGTYDAAGDFAYRVGLPAKSGVGGGIIAIISGRCALAVWHPRLDSHGNSVAGLEAFDRFTTKTGWSVF